MLSTSEGNSGGPMYLKTSYIQFGYPVVVSTLLGIVSGMSVNADHDSVKTAFYQNTGLIVNILLELSNQ